MENTNCLQGLRCPNCGHDERLYITATTTFEVTDDGTGDHDDVLWDSTSPTECPECDFFGDLGDFEIPE